MAPETEEIPKDDNLTSTSLPVNITSDLISLDSNGDAVLAVGDSQEIVKFLISTKVLSLASPVFAKMFGPNFQEGHKLRCGENIEVRLEDDNALAMEVILKALHYYRINQRHPTDVEEMASIAVHCDKYDCAGALSPWISYWLNKFKPMTGPPEALGFLLLTAYILDDAEQFMEISAMAIRNLTISFSQTWKSYEILNFLPENVQSIIATQVQQVLSRLHIITQSVEPTLRRHTACYEMQHEVCVDCGKSVTAREKKRHQCNTREFYQGYCTAESRAAEYFAILEKKELWPSVAPFELCSLSNLAFQLARTKDDLKHYCEAGNGCPLRSELEEFCDKVQKSEEGVLGVCIRCVKNGEWNKNQTCACNSVDLRSTE
ncbi:hypothetical protein BGZ60DRAFT_423350 [Tricladium varicosporioides]|nr:hypothetical protein BGZ60DRAFT_423350 [Hymenoscyphus varicosporioides]